MFDRLNHLNAANPHEYAPAPDHGSTTSTSFNPASISLAIRSEAELAAVNEFLLTLGLPASVPTRGGYPAGAGYSGLGVPPAVPTQAEYGVGAGQNYFDPSALRALALSREPNTPPSTT
jgi:hypothetical protein